MLQERLERRGIPAISLRVGVPHYLGNAKHPQSSIALLQPPRPRARRAAGHAGLAEEGERWRTLHDEAVAEDEQASRAYVPMLEREYDRRRRRRDAVGDDLAAEFERFLREQRGTRTRAVPASPATSV